MTDENTTMMSYRVVRAAASLFAAAFIVVASMAQIEVFQDDPAYNMSVLKWWFHTVGIAMLFLVFNALLNIMGLVNDYAIKPLKNR